MYSSKLKVKFLTGSSKMLKRVSGKKRNKVQMDTTRNTLYPNQSLGFWSREGGGVLPYLGYIGVCVTVKGMVFKQVTLA